MTFLEKVLIGTIVVLLLVIWWLMYCLQDSKMDFVPQEKGQFTKMDAEIVIYTTCSEDPYEDMVFGDDYPPRGEVATTRTTEPYYTRRTIYTIYQETIHYAFALTDTDILCVTIRGNSIFFPLFESGITQVLSEYKK